MVITDFAGLILSKYPSLKTTLRIAHNKTPPELFVKRSLRLSIYMTFGITLLIFFMFAKSTSLPKLLAIMAAAFPVIFFLITAFILQSPKSAIRKRQRDIEKEVLYAGRYLLVKISSGTPLVNTLDDASKSYGVSSKYFGEIMHDINTGVPLEDALEEARTYNSSPQFKRILWQLVTSLKTGTELSNTLRSTLKTIGTQQSIEIKKYAKKLNSLMLFYMIVACVAPSLGLTMLLIISGFLNFQIGNTVLYTVLFFLAAVQIMFIIMVKASRPMVDL